MAEHTQEIESVVANAEDNWKRFRVEDRGSYNHGKFRGELDALEDRALPLAKLLDESEADRERLKARVAELRRVLAFAQSVIKSGEPWTNDCEKTIGAALQQGENDE